MSRQLDLFNDKEITDSFTLHIERKLLTRVKELAKQRGITYRAAFEEALREYVERYDSSRNDSHPKSDN